MVTKRVETVKELASFLESDEPREFHVDLIDTAVWAVYHGDSIVDTVDSARDVVKVLKRLKLDSFRKLSVRLSDPRSGKLREGFAEFVGMIFVLLLKSGIS